MTCLVLYVGSGVIVGWGVIVELSVELGSGVKDDDSVDVLTCPLQAERNIRATIESKNCFFMRLFCKEPANGLRYLRWGGDGEAVQPEKG